MFSQVIVSAHHQATSLAGQDQGGQEDGKHIDETKVIKVNPFFLKLIKIFTKS